MASFLKQMEELEKLKKKAQVAPKLQTHKAYLRVRLLLCPEQLITCRSECFTESRHGCGKGNQSIFTKLA